MYAPLTDSGDRICTAYFADRIGDEHGAALLADLLRWAADGPFRLFVVATDTQDDAAEATHARVVQALAAPPLCDAVERIAIAGDPHLAARAEVLDAALSVPVRHFAEDWHAAQAWLRAPLGV